MWKSEKNTEKNKDTKELVVETVRTRLREKFSQSSVPATDEEEEEDEWIDEDLSDDDASTSGSRDGNTAPAQFGPPNPGQEAVLELLVQFKELWAKISRDPTENSTMSESLNALWEPLNELQKAITANKPAELALKHKAQGVLEESQRFLDGGHNCHQNPARTIRDALSRCRPDDLLDPPPSQAGVKLLDRWEAATFSTRI